MKFFSHSQVIHYLTKETRMGLFEFAKTFASNLQVRKGMALDQYSLGDIRSEMQIGTPTSMDDPDAQVVTSIRTDDKRPWEPERHAVVIDLDVPAMLVPSSTEGHSHLYVDVSIDAKQYSQLLNSLANCGIIERNYALHSQRAGFTAVRLPWVKKRTLVELAHTVPLPPF